MKFLIDAQLPKLLALLLRELGHEALYTLDLPLANRTSDAAINDLSIKERRVLFTKDSDFVDSFVLHRTPWKLLLISTGNITNSELISLFLKNMTAITNGFDHANFIEINRFRIVYHV